MSDTLEVFGTEYSNVTGIKATDNNGDIQTYIKPEGTINITTKGLTDVTAYRTANVDTGTSVPDGGSTNQVLAKDSDTDGDIAWKTVDKTYVGLGNVDNTSDANKPISTATQTALNGKLSTSLKGANSGLAELDANGKVPTSQLPSFVDDVLEYSAQSSFPATGETGKIYIAQDTNKTYRWSGSAYVEISSSLALGTTSSTAYRGDYGNTAYTHATDSSRSTTAQTSGLYKIATTAEGHVASVTAVEKSDITGLGIPAQDTTDLTAMTGTLPIANGGTGKTTALAAANAIIGGLSAWTAAPTDDTYFIRQDTGGGLSFGRAKFSTLWTYIKNKISSVLGLTSSTYGGSAAQVNGHTVAVDVPSDAVFTDTVYTHPTTSGNKHIPSGGSTGQVLKYSADGTAVWGDVSALPAGGAKGQILIKNSTTDGDVTWTSGGSANQVLSRNSSNNAIWRTIREVPDGNSMAAHPQFLQYDPAGNYYGMDGLVFDVDLSDKYEYDENEQPSFSGKFYFNNEPNNIYEVWQYGSPIRIHLPLTTSGAKALFNETHDVNEDGLDRYGIPFTVISAIETINTASTAEAGYDITDYTFNVSRTLKDGSVESKVISCILDLDQYVYDVFVTDAASIPQASGVSF